MTEERVRRRSPVARSEGERRLVQATLELCRERPFGEVTVRDIGRRADVNHGFVHTWFGSKAGLVLASCRVLIDEIAPRVAAGEMLRSGLRTSDIVLLIRLLAWLETEDVDAELFHERRRPVIEVTAATLRRVFGFDEATATTLAEITTAGVAGVALVGATLRFDDEAMSRTWLDMLATYAAAKGVRSERPST